MNASKNQNRFQTGFQEPKTGLPKTVLTSLPTMLFIKLYLISFLKNLLVTLFILRVNFLASLLKTPGC